MITVYGEGRGFRDEAQRFDPLFRWCVPVGENQRTARYP
jgi:hypothetical protein